MEKEKLVDSSVLVALYNDADSQHAKARASMNREAHYALLDIVVCETVTVLNRLLGPQEASAFLDFAQESEQVRIVATGAYMTSYFAAFTKLGSRALSLIDVALLYHSATWDVLTFDLDLQKEITKQKRRGRA